MSDDYSKLEPLCKEIGRTLKGAMPPGIGFTLMLFEFGKGQALSYISSAEREDMVKLLKEFISHLEGSQ